MTVRLMSPVLVMVMVFVGLLAACGEEPAISTTPGAVTLVPTATVDPAVESAGPQQEARFEVGDDLVLTISIGDAQRQFSVTVVEIYKMDDGAVPVWEYQIRWPDGLLRVQEDLPSPKVK